MGKEEIDKIKRSKVYKKIKALNLDNNSIIKLQDQFCRYHGLNEKEKTIWNIMANERMSISYEDMFDLLINKN